MKRMMVIKMMAIKKIHKNTESYGNMKGGDSAPSFLLNKNRAWRFTGLFAQNVL